MTDKIPVLDLSDEIDSLWDELNSAIQAVLRSGQFIMGEPVRQLENEIAAYLGVKHAIAVNSGTDALLIALRALGIGPGDEVITTSFSFFATVEGVSLLGAEPVFADIDPLSFNIDPAAIEACITPRTRALLPVHLFGQPADMETILSLAQKHDLALLEDVAQAFGGEYKGRKLGSLGTMGAFSFFPSKNLGAYGDGGLITTNDDALAEQARMLRAHGSRKKYHNEILGYNSRLDTLQAAILRVKLPHVPDWNRARQQIAAGYNALLADIPGLLTPEDKSEGEHVYHQYTLRILDGRRDAAQAALAEAGISSMIYYPVPIHQLPVYADLGVQIAQAELACAEVLSLPIWPTLSEAQQQRVAAALRDFLVSA
jgi:dTDP-4-amino-4,6-dideoxygalactose transaminase